MQQPDNEYLEPPPPPPTTTPHSPPPTPLRDTTERSLHNGEVATLASPGQRFGARALDICFAIGMYFAAILIYSGVGIDLPTWSVLSLLAAYEIGFVAVKGQTLGKMATHIRVARIDNGAPPGWARSARRWLLPAVGYVLLLLPGMLIQLSWLRDRDRQGAHDRATKTLVVQA